MAEFFVRRVGNALAPDGSDCASVLADRFWGKVNRGGISECWLWKGYVTKAGYGQIDVRKNPAFRAVLYAHRVSMELHSGSPVPPGKEVLHSCDTPRCVNPHHLSVGSHADNMADSARKNRQAAGMRNGRRKLTAVEVLAIRGEQGRVPEIAARYGIGALQVYRIKNRQTWRSLP